ncbi:hypothetical protein QQP08_026181 [Theobroma cacao]|nr:hypothetical protein QQP08_024847 [Theobroma cacao]WRX33694.1 hypothetical protein QQP08_026181 [Theobroma cacao]
MEDTQFRIGRYHESHFSNTWAIACAVGLVPKTNHCQHVIISTSIVITSVSAEYLWPTTLKEPCVSYGLCLFAYLESFGYVGLQSTNSLILSPSPQKKERISLDTVVLEFNHYTPGSRWRRTSINRKDHREEGNEADGFYGGIRKLSSEEEITTWKRLWPAEILE